MLHLKFCVLSYKIRSSSFPIPNSKFRTQNSKLRTPSRRAFLARTCPPLTTFHSLLTIVHSPLPTDHSPLPTDHLLLAPWTLQSPSQLEAQNSKPETSNSKLHSPFLISLFRATHSLLTTAHLQLTPLPLPHLPPYPLLYRTACPIFDTGASSVDSHLGTGYRMGINSVSMGEYTMKTTHRSSPMLLVRHRQ